MEKMFENPILDDLYEVRGEELENAYKKKYGESNAEKRADEKEDEFINTLKKNVADKEKLEETMSRLNEFEMAIIDKFCSWYKQYYKLGFADAMRLEKEIRQFII